MENKYTLKNKKIAIVHPNNTHFLKEIWDHLQQNNEIVEINRDNSDKMGQALKECDLAFFEWCSELLETATQDYPKTCPIVCRLHSIEAFNGKASKVNWKKVDHLIVVSPILKKIMTRYPAYSNLGVPETTVVNILINTDLFNYSVRKYTNNVGFIGNIESVKNPVLLLQCMHKIKKNYPNYKLHLIGDYPPDESRLPHYWEYYIRKQKFSVYKHPKSNRENLPLFYRGMDFILSTSYFEGTHTVIAEAMACGAIPLIHAWEGADKIYPAKFVWNSLDEFEELFKKYVYYISSHNFETSKECRRYILNNFKTETQLEQIEEIFSKVMETYFKD